MQNHKILLWFCLFFITESFIYASGGVAPKPTTSNYSAKASQLMSSAYTGAKTAMRNAYSSAQALAVKATTALASAPQAIKTSSNYFSRSNAHSVASNASPKPILPTSGTATSSGSNWFSSWLTGKKEAQVQPEITIGSPILTSGTAPTGHSIPIGSPTLTSTGVSTTPTPVHSGPAWGFTKSGLSPVQQTHQIRLAELNARPLDLTTVTTNSSSTTPPRSKPFHELQNQEWKMPSKEQLSEGAIKRTEALLAKNQKQREVQQQQNREFQIRQEKIENIQKQQAARKITSLFKNNLAQKQAESKLIVEQKLAEPTTTTTNTTTTRAPEIINPPVPLNRRLSSSFNVAREIIQQQNISSTSPGRSLPLSLAEQIQQGKQLRNVTPTAKSLSPQQQLLAEVKLGNKKLKNAQERVLPEKSDTSTSTNNNYLRDALGKRRNQLTGETTDGLIEIATEPIQATNPQPTVIAKKVLTPEQVQRQQQIIQRMNNNPANSSKPTVTLLDQIRQKQTLKETSQPQNTKAVKETTSTNTNGSTLANSSKVNNMLDRVKQQKSTIVEETSEGWD